ncbi:erg26, C-3 sterol dehydrogenase [Pseudocyphellaria aurata]|nr:erg26, C-3 sterol dehydrogenase [Pseudocyphellaria aurata]
MSKPVKSLGSVLVIGGCGFLGHHIVSQLRESYTAQVSVLDLRTDRNRIPSISYYDGDITSEADVTRVLEEVKPNVIIHTASPAFVADDGQNKPVYKKVNVDGTRNLIELAGKIGCVKAFIYTSSASVVHDAVSDLPNADERWPVLHPPQQREYYAETKALAESIVLSANRKYGDMLTVALRPASVFGEGDVQMIPSMLTAYKKGQTKFQLGRNTNLFDFSYVGNIAYGHILAAIALLSTQTLSTQPLDHERVDGEAFFLTNDTPLYFWDFARMVWATAGDTTVPSQVWVINKEAGLVIASLIEWIFWLLGRKPNLTRKMVNYSSMTRYYNIDKAKRLLGYQPLIGVEEAIVRSVKWFHDRHEHGEATSEEKKTR